MDLSAHHGRLTDENFWDEYWSSVSLPAKLDLRDPATRSLASRIDEQIKLYLGEAPASEEPEDKGLGPLQGGPRDIASQKNPEEGVRAEKKPRKTPRQKCLVEIGCAPGRWLEYFHKAGFLVTGIESAPDAAKLTEENLKILGVDASVYKADAETLPVECPFLARSFDCVLSLGLVEHFENPQSMVSIHRWLAKPGGLVLIGVPNYGGLSGALQRHLDDEWLRRHNTRLMTPSALLEAGQTAGLLPLEASYVGGFDPNLYNWRGRSYLGYLITRAGKVFGRIPGSDRLQSRHLSSYILASFRAPDDSGTPTALPPARLTDRPDRS